MHVYFSQIVKDKKAITLLKNCIHNTEKNTKFF